MDAAKIAGALKTLVELAENSKVAQQFKRVVIVSTVVAGALLWGMQARPELADKYKAFKRASENQEVVEWIFLGCVILAAIMLMSWVSAKWDARGKKKAEEAAKKKVYDKLAGLGPWLRAYVLYLNHNHGTVSFSGRGMGSSYGEELQQHGITMFSSQGFGKSMVFLNGQYSRAVKEDASCVTNLREDIRVLYLQFMEAHCKYPGYEDFMSEYEFVREVFEERKAKPPLEHLFIDPAKVPENLWGEEVTDVG